MENRKVRMTVGQFVDAAVGHRFVIAPSVKGILGIHERDDSFVLYHGDRFDVPEVIRNRQISCWAGDCNFASPEYAGAILIVVC